MKLDPRLKDTEFVIEADSFARQTLWAQYCTQSMHKTDLNTIRWDDDCMGTMIQVGTLDERPVLISLVWAKLNGHLLMFVDGTSQLVDHAMIEDWLKKYCNPSWDNGRRAHVDASNFHHVISYIRDCEADQLLKEATAHAELGNPDDAAHLIAQCWRDYPYNKDKECQKLAKTIKGMKGHPGIKLERK